MIKSDSSNAVMQRNKRSEASSLQLHLYISRYEDIGYDVARRLLTDRGPGERRVKFSDVEKEAGK